MAATLLQQVHRNMLKDAVPLIQELRKKQGNNISEDDIREQFHKAFDKHKHINLEYAQECNGRKDMAIQEKDKKTGKNIPVLLYELKTYFKPHEIPHLDIGEMMEDVYKLYTRKSNAKAYFIMVCKRNLVNTCPDFIKETGTNSVGLNKKYTVKALLYDVTITAKHREVNNDFVILSWEVEKKPIPKKKK